MSKPYVVVFKSETPASVIEGEIADVKAKGGSIRQQYDSDILKGFAAVLPEEKVQAFSAATAKGDHEYLSYIEADQEVKTQ